MKINNLEKFKKKINSGHMALGAYVSFCDSAISELAAEAGFDFCWIDLEHGVMTDTDLMNHIIALRGTDCAPIVRVADVSHTRIKRVIDMAPAGIIVPMVNTADEARSVVEACRYPMHGGSRGCGFRRGIGYGSADINEYIEQAREDPWVIIQIEHKDAVKNLDEILKVDGLNSICIGPYDLAASMNKFAKFDDPEVSDTFDMICAKARAAGVAVGSVGSDAEVWRRRGVNWLQIAGDWPTLFNGFKAKIASV